MIVSWLGKLIGIDAEYFFKNSFWVSFRSGVGMVAGFFLGIVFARVAPKETYGQYVFVFSAMYMVAFLAVPKFDFAVSQAVAKGFDQSLFQSTKISLIGSLLASICMWVLAARYFYLGDPNLGYGLLIAGIFFPLLFGLKAYDHFLMGKKRFDLSAQFSAIASILTAIGLIIGLLVHMSLPGLLFVYFFINAGLNVVYFFRVKRLVRNKKQDPDVVGYGLYLTALAVVAIVVTKLGSVLLNHYDGAAVLATYSVAIIMPKAVQDLMQNFIDVAKIKVADKNRKELVNVCKRHGAKWVLLGIGACTALWIGLPILIPLIYSDKYNDAILYSQVASLALIFFPFSTFLGNLILLEKKRKIIALTHFFPSVPNIVLLPVFIARFGIWGAIGVNLFSWVYMTPFYWWAFWREKDL